MINLAESELAKKNVELDKLTRVLEKMEFDFDELKGSIEKFELRYSFEVGQKLAELERLDIELAELVAKKIHHGHGVNHKSFGIESASEDYNEAFNNVNNAARSESHSVQELKEVKKLYRKIAAIIHPDKAKTGESHPFRTVLMAELNEAYSRKDTIHMQRILDKWLESPEAVEGEGIAVELDRTQRAVAQIKKRILEIETEMSKMLRSDKYAMMEKVREAERAGRDAIAEMSVSIDSKIQDARSQILLRMYG